MDDPTKNPNEQGFIAKLVSAVPPWALGSIGTLLTLALVLKIIGIDFSGPINELTSAYVEVIKLDAQEVERGEEFRVMMTAMMQEQRDFMASQMGELQSAIAEDAKAIAGLEDAMTDIRRDLIRMDLRLEQVENLAHESEGR